MAANLRSTDSTVAVTREVAFTIGAKTSDAFGKEVGRAGVPLFRSSFPASPARSSRVQFNGKKRRSCSPG